MQGAIIGERSTARAGPAWCAPAADGRSTWQRGTGDGLLRRFVPITELGTGMGRGRGGSRPAQAPETSSRSRLQQQSGGLACAAVRCRGAKPDVSRRLKGEAIIRVSVTGKEAPPAALRDRTGACADRADWPVSPSKALALQMPRGPTLSVSGPRVGVPTGAPSRACPMASGKRCRWRTDIQRRTGMRDSQHLTPANWRGAGRVGYFARKQGAMGAAHKAEGNDDFAEKKYSPVQ